MIVVIQCAASKRRDAGHLVTAAGVPIDFVADPTAAQTNTVRLYAHPDDLSDQGFFGQRMSWREVLLRYNEKYRDSRANPLDLCRAYQIYENPVYGGLVCKFGSKQIYILSAGWGLIPADFLTPYYDISFSKKAEGYKRRGKNDSYKDFMLPATTKDEIVFFGGRDYLLLFSSLTREIRVRKTVFYNSAGVPEAPGCSLKRYETTTRTNWQYKCANDFLDGKIHVCLAN